MARKRQPPEHDWVYNVTTYAERLVAPLFIVVLLASLLPSKPAIAERREPVPVLHEPSPPDPDPPSNYSFDWAFGQVHVTIVEVTFIPDRILFQIDTAVGPCPANTWLTWRGHGPDA
jgi:hypothetical protein